MLVGNLEFDNSGSSVDRRVGDLLRETKDRIKSQICGLGADSSSGVAVISDCQTDHGQTNYYVANSETYNLLHCDAAPA